MRKHRADIARPFRMWLYPIPSAIAFIGWSYIFLDLRLALHRLRSADARRRRRRLLAVG